MGQYKINGEWYHGATLTQAKMAADVKARRLLDQTNPGDPKPKGPIDALLEEYKLEPLTAVEGGHYWDGRTSFGSHFIDVNDHTQCIEVHGSEELRNLIVDLLNDTDITVEISIMAERDGHEA